MDKQVSTAWFHSTKDDKCPQNTNGMSLQDLALTVQFSYKLQVVSGNDDPHGKLLLLQFEQEHVWHGTQTIVVHENLIQLLISILL
jgi:hypothetical protein